jgi:uncharacterized protein YcbK (DUF882 family)
MNMDFVATLDRIRERCGFPLVVSSGYRTPERNRQLGGAANSAHVQGVAADLVIPEPRSRNRKKMMDAAQKEGISRIGIMRTALHLDASTTLPQEVYWDYY